MNLSVSLRPIAESDKTVYRDLVYSHFRYKKIFTDAVFDNTWKNAMSDDMAVFAIIKNDSSDICGFCQLRELNTRTPSIGINMIDSYMGRGYAQAAVRLLIDYAYTNLSLDYLIWEADKNNTVSRHIAEKMGGELIEINTTLSQSVIDLALKTGTLKEEDISYIYVYKIQQALETT